MRQKRSPTISDRTLRWDVSEKSGTPNGYLQPFLLSVSDSTHDHTECQKREQGVQGDGSPLGRRGFHSVPGPQAPALDPATTPRQPTSVKEAPTLNEDVELA